MAYIQPSTPPPNKIFTFTLKSFVGGLNNRSQQLSSNECTDVINMKFADDTIMEKRFGSTSYDATTLTGAITFLDEFKPYGDVDALIRASDTDIVFGDAYAKVGGTVSGANFQGKYYYADGVALRAFGWFPQTDSSPHVDVIGTPVNGYTVMQVVNPPSGFTPLGTTHTEGVWKYDYTNQKTWYEPCQNEIDDEFKGSNVLPENPKYVAVHKGRLIVSGSNKDNDNVFISDVQNALYFPVYLPIQLPPNSDKVMGLHIYDDAVIVGREDDVYAIHGETNNPSLGFRLFELKKLNAHAGFASNQAVNVAHNYLFYLGSDGNAYSMSSSRMSPNVLATTILTNSIDLLKEPISLSKADYKTASSTFFDDEWYVSIKDKVLVYSYRHKAWTMYNQLNARSFYEMNNELIWGNTSGSVAKFSTDFMDFGKPFKATWASKYFDMDEPSTYKQFREFFIVAHTYRDISSDIRVNFQVDYADVKQEHEIQNQISIWGKALWGDRFVNRNMVASLPLMIGRRGRAIKFIFSNSYFEEASVLTYTDLEAVPEKHDNMLAYVQDESTYYLYLDFEWHKQTNEDLNQRMKIYQVNGDYELRGKR